MFPCQKHCDNVSSAATEEEKLQATGAYMEHIRKAQREREFYNECMRKCKESIETSNIVPGANVSNTSDISNMHYISLTSHNTSPYPICRSRSELRSLTHLPSYECFHCS